MRVLHAPVNIGNQPWMLSRFERRAGMQSELVVTQSSWLKYSADRFLANENEPRWRTRFRTARFAAVAPFRFDVMHYYFGRSLFGDDPARRLAFADLKWAKRLGKPVFLTLQGCDVRLAHRSQAMNSVTMCRQGACPEYADCVAATDQRRERFIDQITPLADQVFYLNPELGHFLPQGTFLPYVNIDVDSIPVSANESRRSRPLILHAPTDSGIKGTNHVLQAIEALRSRYDFEFKLIQGLPHSEALALYAQADLVIDQLLAGWYGGFAVEVMAMAKPVVCYLRESDLQNIPAQMRAELPLLRAEPSNITERLAEILDQRSRWAQWGAKGREFVQRWHHPGRIANALIAAYKEPAHYFDAASLPEQSPGPPDLVSSS